MSDTSINMKVVTGSILLQDCKTLHVLVRGPRIVGEGLAEEESCADTFFKKKRVTRISTMGDKRQASLTCLSTVRARLVTESH